MFSLTPQTAVFMATKPVDFRKGIDGLAALCRQRLHKDPMNGSVFLFYNKQRMAMKILCYDGQGFWLFTKRLSQGRFTQPFSSSHDQPTHEICYRSLYVLIHNGDPGASKMTQNWKALKPQ